MIVHCLIYKVIVWVDLIYRHDPNLMRKKAINDTELESNSGQQVQGQVHHLLSPSFSLYILIM